MKRSRTVLCQKDPIKGNAVENYCLITCLPLMRKLLAEVIAEELYDYLEQEILFFIVTFALHLNVKNLKSPGNLN